MTRKLTLDSVAGLKALRRLRQTRRGRDLDQVAARFGVTRRAANLALDALIGRTEAEALAALHATLSPEAVSRRARRALEPLFGQDHPKGPRLGKFMKDLFGPEASHG
jgi:hypothetical protein